jgi:hypothetical protein
MTNSTTRNASQGSATSVADSLLAFWARIRGAAKAAHPCLTALLLCAAATLGAQTMIDGSAIVTSRSGKVRATDANGKNISMPAHEIIQPEGLEIATKKNGQIFLVLSNGVAVALDGASSIKCLEYTQRPFTKKEQRPEFEPSVSKFQLQFDQGQIAIASNRLSPLSELRIQLPMGEIRLHKGTCLISYDATGLHITAFDGNLTYYYPDGNSREFVSAPKSIRISEQSIALQQIAEAATADSLEADATRLCQAAQHASKRVTFEPNDVTLQPPVPVLIVRPSYFQQPTTRPYQFKD